MKNTAKKTAGRIQRHRRIRMRVSGTPEKPRLAFFRSNKHLYAQIIDDTVGKTLVGISVPKGGEESARKMGDAVAKQAAEKDITKVVFDRGGFVYTGTVKLFAEAARAGGLQF